MDDSQRLIWDDRYLLGYKPMDDVHREFVELVDALLSVPEADLPEVLAAFADHAQAHFDQENRLMDEMDLPLVECHKDEHAKVLASVLEVQRLNTAGDARVVRELALALKEWFPSHADQMDSALAKWAVQRALGGVPLVFRREAWREAREST